MAITLPRNPLIEFTNLNTYSQKNINKVNSIHFTGTTTTIYTNTTSDYPGGPIRLNGVSGITNGNYAVTEYTPTSLSFTTTPRWTVASIDRWSSDGSALGNPTYYYNRFILNTANCFIPEDSTITTYLTTDDGIITGTKTVLSPTTSSITVSSTTLPSGAQPRDYPSNGGFTSIKPPSFSQNYIQLTSMSTVAPLPNNAQWTYSLAGSSTFLSDHSRRELSIDFEKIERGDRMADGTMRKTVVAFKRNLSVSWELLPAEGTATVDGKAGGRDLLNIYNRNVGDFTINLYNGESAKKGSLPAVTMQVRIKSFNYDIVKRNIQLADGSLTDLWNVSMTLEEI